MTPMFVIQEVGSLRG